MSDNKTIDNVHVHIYGHEMLGEVISRARKNNIPYDKDMYYDFHSHGHSYLVFKDGELTLLEDPTPSHYKETSLNYFFELYFSKEVGKQLVVGKWYKGNVDFDSLVFITEIEPTDTFNRIYGYGFIFDNYCKLGHLFSKTDHEKSLVEATPQEVEKALIEEAKRRYKIGDVIKCLDGVESEVKGTAFVFYNNCLFSNGERVNGGDWFNTSAKVFENGQWATIIEQDKLAELKEAHNNGAEIQFYDEKRKCWFDCGIPCWNPKFKYRIKTEEKPKVGDVIKAWVTKEDEYFIGVLSSIDTRGDYVVKFQNSYDTNIYTFRARYAKTLTKQETIELLFGKERVDD